MSAARRLQHTFTCCPSVRLSVCPSVRLSVCPSVRLSVCPSVRLSVCPSVRLSVCPSVRLSFCPSVRLSVCPSVRLSVCPSVRLSVCPSVRLSVCPSVRLSVCPSVRLSVCPSEHLTRNYTRAYPKTNIKQSAVNIYTILFREQLFSTFITIYNTTRTTRKLLHSPYQVSHPHPMLLRTRTLSQCLNIQVSFPVHHFSGSISRCTIGAHARTYARYKIIILYFIQIRHNDDFPSTGTRL